ARRGATLTRSLLALIEGDPAAASTPATGTPAVDLSGNESVLVVEDEAPVRDVVCRALRARGYAVLEAQNGEDAIAVATRFNAQIQLVVSDVVMTEMDGRALFERLR